MSSKTNVALAVVFASVAFLHIGHELWEEQIIVNTIYGKVKGFSSTSRDGQTYYEFRGIPYASPPIGDLRFEPPVPPKKWKGIKSAFHYGSRCLQVDPFMETYSGDEDCLSLNVHVPRTPSLKIGDVAISKTGHDQSELLPVLIYIHGGLFTLGAGSDYKPIYFMDNNIIVVTINYRLSSFGFLNTGDGLVRGNMGLKDQVMAMKWVRDNIRNFNGDPNKVTIMGESAGASSVTLHMLSSMSKGLFHRAISMSGTALNHWTLTKNPKQQALRLGKRLGCPTNSTKGLVKCLKKLDAHVINQNHGEMINALLRDREAAFSPTIESVQDSNSFLNEDPFTLVSNGSISTKVPWINGVNSEEGLVYAVGVMRLPGVAKELTANYTHWFPILFDFQELSESTRVELSHKIYKMYFGDKEISMDLLEQVVNLFSDSSFYVGSDIVTKQLSKYMPMYNYYYTYRGHFGTAQLFFSMSGYLPKELDAGYVLFYNWISEFVFGVKQHHYGACHFDEIPMFFKMDYVTNIKKSYEEYPFSKALVKIWSDFVKDGKPSRFKGIEWPTTNTKIPMLYMQLDNTPKVIEETIITQRLDIWKTILNITKTKVK